jgi:serine/threonine protein phosphatase 1
VTTLVVGDVHGCAEELRLLLDRVQASRVVLVGDMFTKGPDPVGVMHLIHDRGLEVVRGNHDQRLLDAQDGRRSADAHAHAVIAALHRSFPSWRAVVDAWPLWRRAGRYLVTHAALHPSGEIARTDPRTHLLARRWPDDSDPNHPFWWEIYEGPPVVFGHDAVRGFIRVDREGLPWVIGLDTGCVYGGSLTGWIVEAEERVEVPAFAAYCPVAGSV